MCDLKVVELYMQHSLSKETFTKVVAQSENGSQLLSLQFNHDKLRSMEANIPLGIRTCLNLA